MIDKDKHIKIKCGWCSIENPIEDWENNTRQQCITREMRRAYKSIYNEKVFESGDHYYMCPTCKAWSTGEQLKIVGTTDTRLLKLGRKPIHKSKK